MRDTETLFKEGNFMQKKVEQLEAEKAERFLFDMFELDEEEFAAIWGMEEMTQELFNSCLTKSITQNYISVYNELCRKYPELCSNYEKQLIGEAEAVECPEKTDEEKETDWQNLCKRIREKYGEDAI